jgi:hypothetical protein
MYLPAEPPDTRIGRLLLYPFSPGGITYHDGTLLYSSDAGHGDDVALVNNPISEGEAA